MILYPSEKIHTSNSNYLSATAKSQIHKLLIERIVLFTFFSRKKMIKGKELIPFITLFSLRDNTGRYNIYSLINGFSQIFRVDNVTL